jgi:hypothetical protein
MAKRIPVIVLAILLASFIYVVALPNASAVTSTKVYVDPPNIEDTGLTPNTTFNVSVKLEGIPPDPGLAGVSFTLRWNPTILTGTVIQEILFHNVTPPDSWDNIWNIKLKFNNTDGSVDYAQTWQDIELAKSDGYCPISGTGAYVIANITLKVIGTGKCPLHLEAVKLGDPNAQPVSVQTVDGSFSNIVAPPPPTPALIYVYPAKTVNSSLTSGTNFTVNIDIINASGVGGLEFKLGFNSTALNAQSVARGSFIPISATLLTEIDNTTGFAKFNVSLPSSLDGNGIVAVVQFQVMADNVNNSTLHLYDVNLVDTSNQSLTFTTIDGSFTNTKTLPGDLNGDNTVDIYDAQLAANAFGSKPGDDNWNPVADMDGNGTVDIFDLVILCQNFGRKL